MNKRKVFIFLSVACLLIAGWRQGGAAQANRTVLKLGKCSIKVEVVNGASLLESGLSGRKELAQDAGMLFVFGDPDYYSFWMKGMKFPLDFIWILDGEVIQITPNVPPPSMLERKLPTYSPLVPVNFVLEVNAGIVKKCGVKVGDMIVLPLY